MLQQTEEWTLMRLNKIGASDAPVIMGVSPWKSIYRLWEEKVGLYQEEEEKTFYQRRGLDLESAARDYFFAMTGIEVFAEVVFHAEHDFMMASLDGMSLDKKLILEIKCPGKKDHETALLGNIPPKYYPQVQHQIEVCNVDFAFYLSFDGEEGTILEIKRDDDYINRMVQLERKFWEHVVGFFPPP